MTSSIGKLQRVPLRDVWKHEAYDFTQWLQQNIDILNEGFKMPELTKNGSDEDAKDDIAADGGADGDAGKKVDDVPAGAIPVAS